MLGYGRIGLMAIIASTIKLRMEEILIKNPLFHLSTIPIFHG